MADLKGVGTASTAVAAQHHVNDFMVKAKTVAAGAAGVKTSFRDYSVAVTDEKAIPSAAGIVPLHIEDAIFARESVQLAGHTANHTSRDWIAGMTAFKAVLLEGLEVAFIVIAVGSGPGLLAPATIGALAASCSSLPSGSPSIDRWRQCPKIP